MDVHKKKPQSHYINTVDQYGKAVYTKMQGEVFVLLHLATMSIMH